MAGNQRPRHYNRPASYEYRQEPNTPNYTRDSAFPSRDLFPDRARHIRDRRGSSHEYIREQRSYSDSFQAFGNGRDRRGSRYSPPAGDFADFRGGPGYSRRSSDTSLTQAPLALRRRSPSPPYFSRGVSSSHGDYSEDYRSSTARPMLNRPSVPGLSRRSTESGRFGPRRSYDPNSQVERDRLEREKEAKEYKEAVNKTQQTSRRTHPQLSGPRDRSASVNGLSQPGLSPKVKEEEAEVFQTQSQSVPDKRAPPTSATTANGVASEGNGNGRSSPLQPQSTTSQSHEIPACDSTTELLAPDQEIPSDVDKMAKSEDSLKSIFSEDPILNSDTNEQHSHAEHPKSVDAEGYVNPFDMMEDDSSNDGAHRSIHSTSPVIPKEGNESIPNRIALQVLHRDENQTIKSPLSPVMAANASLDKAYAGITKEPDKMITSPAASEASTIYIARPMSNTSQRSLEVLTTPLNRDNNGLAEDPAATDTISIASDMDDLRSSPGPSRRGSAYTVDDVPVIQRQYTDEHEYDNQLIAQLCGREEIPSADDGVADDSSMSKSTLPEPVASPLVRMSASPVLQTKSQSPPIKVQELTTNASDRSQSYDAETSMQAIEMLEVPRVDLEIDPPERRALVEHSALAVETQQNLVAQHTIVTQDPLAPRGIEEDHNDSEQSESGLVSARVDQQNMPRPLNLESDFAKLSSEKTTPNAIEAAISDSSKIQGHRDQFMKSLTFVSPSVPKNGGVCAQIMQENQQENGNVHDVERRRPFTVPTVNLQFERKSAVVKLLGQKIKASCAEYEKCKHEFTMYNKKWQQHTARCDGERLIEIEQEEKDAAIAASASASIRGTRNKPIGYEINEAMVGITLPNNALNEASIPNMIWRPIEREFFNYVDWNSKVYDVNAHYFEIKPEREWTVEEHDKFFMLYRASPKEFGKIAENMPGLPPNRKTACECVQHYYLTKKKIDYRQLGKKVRASTRGRGRGRKVVVPKSTRRMQLANSIADDGEDSSAEDESDNRALRRRRTAIESEEIARKKIRKAAKRPEPASVNKADVRPSQEHSRMQMQPLPVISNNNTPDLKVSGYDHTKQGLPGRSRNTGRWNEHEETIFLNLLQKLGTNFAAMLTHLPGKTFDELQVHFDDNLIERGYRQYLPRSVLGPTTTYGSHSSSSLGTPVQPLQIHPEMHRPAQVPQHAYHSYSSYQASADHRTPNAYSSYQGPTSQVPSFSSHQLPPFNSGPYDPASNTYDGASYRQQGPSRPMYDPRYDTSRSGVSTSERSHVPVRGSIDSMLNSGEKVQLPPINGDLRGGPARFGAYYQQGGPNAQVPFGNNNNPANNTNHNHNHPLPPLGHGHDSSSHRDHNSSQNPGSQHPSAYDHQYSSGYRGPPNQSYYR